MAQNAEARADRFQTRAAGAIERAIVARQRVVVADSERFQPMAQA